MGICRREFIRYAAGSLVAQYPIRASSKDTNDPREGSAIRGSSQRGVAGMSAHDSDLRHHHDVLAYIDFKDVTTVLSDLGRSNWSDGAHRAWYAVRHLRDGSPFCADSPDFLVDRGLRYMRFGGKRDIMAAHLFAPRGVRHAFARYVIVIESDVPRYMTELGVKLPGLAGMYEDTILRPPHAGTRTFSWRMEHGPKDKLSVRDYLYDQSTGSGFGDIKDYGIEFAVDVPITIEQELDVDTGVGRVWIDGKLIAERRIEANVDIEELFLNFYHGGMRFATEPIHYRIAGACIAKSYIGVPPELLPPKASAAAANLR